MWEVNVELDPVLFASIDMTCNQYLLASLSYLSVSLAVILDLGLHAP